MAATASAVHMEQSLLQRWYGVDAQPLPRNVGRRVLFPGAAITKYPKLGGFTEIYHLSVLEARSPKSK